ncbi:hypothetical protein [Arthrobacter sp. NicSoilC5]|uniref:hypothetical protein n=1 Tax=Arthrobacter sp. NicSoilC5 TaxID=2831000 RepID=UPI001CC3705E|nr:hypothetical protein [Arthrobacter sp. NicSoilC5]
MRAETYCGVRGPAARSRTARERAIMQVSRRHGYNLNQEYTCVILPPDEDDD